MTVANDDSTVKVHYTGTLADGTVFDSSRERDPLEITLGEGNLIAGFEKAVVGMEVGDTREVEVPADDAYGQRNPELVYDLPLERLPEGVGVGSQLQANTESGATINLVIVEMGDDSATLDANHPLAGCDLKFEIELVEVVS